MAGLGLPVALPVILISQNKKRIMKAFIVLLFLLNFCWLFTYFLHNPGPINIHLHLHHHNHPINHPTNRHNHHLNRHPNGHLNRHRHVSTAKPWSILPSYLPWSANDVALGSCEGYFGNGFTETLTILPRKTTTSDSATPGPGSWMTCHFSGTLRSSICEGGGIRMDPAKIRMSKGGERIEEVIGRKDEDELPVFEDGAFQVQGKGKRIGNGEIEGKMKRVVSEEFLEKYVPEGEILKHTMRELFGSIEEVDDLQCSQWIEEPVLLLTRFEYANVFHTYTDWYSAYVSSRVTGLPTRPHVIFVDGHCKTQLEETWEALFSSVKFAKNFSSPVCFRHAVFSPLGYETAWFKGLSEPIDCHGASAKDLWANPDDRKTARLSEFGEMVKAAFDLPVDVHRSPKPPPLGYNVLFLRREDYLAHPRHSGKVESRLSNEQEVFDALERWASNHSECKVNLVNGLFAHMPMREQLRAIEDAYVIIGAHGAGLTHVVSALPKTVILEIIASQYRRPHFQLISQWKGLDYRAINLPGSYADTKDVIEQLKKILKSIGC